MVSGGKPCAGQLAWRFDGDVIEVIEVGRGDADLDDVEGEDVAREDDPFKGLVL